jgi:hypothetical protein
LPAQFQIHVQFLGIESSVEPTSDIVLKSGAEIQSHSHVQVPSASCPADVAEADGDIAGDDGVPELDVGTEDVEGVAEGDACGLAAVATFTCVTGPLSPALPIRTLTFTFVGDAWTATAGGDGATDDAAGAGAPVSPAVSAVEGMISRS